MTNPIKLAVEYSSSPLANIINIQIAHESEQTRISVNNLSISVTAIFVESWHTRNSSPNGKIFLADNIYFLKYKSNHRNYHTPTLLLLSLVKRNWIVENLFLVLDSVEFNVCLHKLYMLNFFLPFSVLCLLKGQTYLNKSATFSYRFLLVCMPFSGHQALKG